MAFLKAKSVTMNKNVRSNNNDDLTLGIGDDLFMEEILPRLPAKQLIRSKLVCKKWNSTISTPEFAKLHLKFTYSKTQNCHFIVDPRILLLDLKRTVDPRFLLPYTPLINANELIPLPQVGNFTQADSFEMVDSCDGLVCLYHKADVEEIDRCFFILWNPATRQHREIPSPDGVRVSKSPYGVHVSRGHGFGYVPSLDDYVIVASFWTEFVFEFVYYGFYVYSFREGKWERVRDESCHECLGERLCGVAVMVGDTMFWASYYNVVGFDVVTKEFKEYPWLNWQYGYRCCKLYRVKGCLTLRLTSENYHVTDFWMLKNASDWYSDHSWQKISSADLRNVSLLIFSETGKCLVRRSKEFKLVDPCKEALESARDSGAHYRNWLVTKDHIESLISPFAITKVE